MWVVHRNLAVDDDSGRHTQEEANDAREEDKAQGMPLHDRQLQHPRQLVDLVENGAEGPTHLFVTPDRPHLAQRFTHVTETDGGSYLVAVDFIHHGQRLCLVELVTVYKAIRISTSLIDAQYHTARTFEQR